MFILTEHIDPPPSDNQRRYGLGFWKQQQRLYFYASTTCTITKSSTIYRLDLDQNLTTWELVGTLDFWCCRATLTPCGKYFWSVEAGPSMGIRIRWLKFRRISLSNLHYDEYEVPGLDPTVLGEVQKTSIQWTSHSGAILFINTDKWYGVMKCREWKTLLFRMQTDDQQKIVQLKEIRVPGLKTAAPCNILFPVDDFWVKNSSFGLIDDQYSLLFYQIDYFGDVFVYDPLNSTSQWVQFELEGDKIKSLMLSEDRDLWNQRMSVPDSSLFYGWRYQFSHGLVHSVTKWEAGAKFYQLTFTVETQVCRSKLLFSTSDKFGAITSSVISSSKDCGPRRLMLVSPNQPRNPYFWEQVIIGQVSDLTTIAYWTVRRVIFTKKQSYTIPSKTDVKLPETKSLNDNIAEGFGRARARNERNVHDVQVPPVEQPETSHNADIEERATTLNLPSRKSYVRPNKDTTALPLVTPAQINCLLLEICNNKDFP